MNKNSKLQEETQEQSLSIISQSIVMPAVSPKQAKEAWKQYQDLKSVVVDKETDIQKIEGKDFLKKSYWRKIATFFNLTVEVVEESHEQVGKTVVWHFTCKAIAPNGRSAVGVGSCDAFEKAEKRDGEYVKKGNVTKWGKNKEGKSYPMEFEWVPATPNSLHNIRSTAETRAYNRAVSNLVGGGEVSAEEVAGLSHDESEDIKKESSTNVTRITNTSGPSATQKQINLILVHLNQKGMSKEEVYEKWGITSLKDMTIDQASQTIEDLNNISALKSREEESIDLDQVEVDIERIRAQDPNVEVN